MPASEHLPVSSPDSISTLSSRANLLKQKIYQVFNLMTAHTAENTTLCMTNLISNYLSFL